MLWHLIKDEISVNGLGVHRYMKDFEKIYQLGDQKQYAQALAKIYDSNNKALREDYLFDQNQAWYIVANLFYQLNQLDEATYAYKKALEFQEDDIDVYLALSNILNQQKNYTEAIQLLQKALIMIQDDRLFYNYANNLFDQGNFLHAIEYYQKVSPKHPDLYQFAQKNLTTATQNLISLQS